MLCLKIYKYWFSMCSSTALAYILLKRRLESVVRISKNNWLQTPADSERINISSSNFQRMFPIWQSSISVKSNSF